MRPIRKFTIAVSSAFLFVLCAFAEEKMAEDPNKLFYVGNSYYEKRDYSKALEEYLKICDMGLESGNLYYNIGNSFFKLGKIGYAILNYERARRIMPQDTDLKANLTYAKSLVGSSASQAPSMNVVVSAIKAPFKYLNLNAMIISAFVFYLTVIAFAVTFLINPFFAKRSWVLFLVFLTIFAINVAAFAMRYYDEKALHRGVVVEKEADCKYEPIDKSTTYYRLQEGDEAVILATKGDWRHIKRLDGKIAWVKKDALEEI